MPARSKPAPVPLFLVSLVLVSLALVCFPTQLIAQSCTPPSGAPNVVFILFDDLGYGSLGTYGASHIESPHLDAFAAEARKFDQYYVNSPVCSPARVSVLSGEYPHRFNVRDALANGSFSFGRRTSKVGIPEYIYTLPEMLQDQCYRTVHLGKWHAGAGKDEFGPSAVGFDEWAVRIPGLVNAQKCGHYWDETLERHDGTVFSTCPQLPDPPDGVICEQVCTNFTDWQIDEAIRTIQDHIATNSGQPLFLNLWLRATHSPFVLAPNVGSGKPVRPLFTAPTAIANEYDGIYSSTAQGYAALVTHADRRLGDLLAHPALQEFWRDTLVFVTSDNGAPKVVNADPLPGQNLVTPDPNGELRGKKGNSWEGGTRVPMMVRWPAGQIDGSSGDSDFPFASFDVYPTLADLLDLDLESLGLSGQSVLEQLQKPDSSSPSERDLPLFWEWRNGLVDFAIRDGKWKYVRRLEMGQRDHLYDMSGAECVDPGLCEDETFNLAVSDPAFAGPAIDELTEQYRRWRSDSTAIDWGVGCSEAGVLNAGDQLFDFGSGGRVELCSPAGPDCRSDDPRQEPSEQSFSFALRLRAAALPAAGQKAWVAGQDGAWDLALRPDGHLELTLHGEDCLPDTCFTTTALTSDSPLTLGRWTHVAFVMFARGTSHLTYGYQDVQLWVDGALQADQSPRVDTEGEVIEGVLAVVANGEPLTLGGHDPSVTGSACNSTEPSVERFLGALSHVRMHTAGFMQEELPDLARAPVSYEVEQLYDGAVQEGDWFHFPTAGRVMLRGPCQGVACADSYPLFDFGASSFTFGVALWPDPPASGRTDARIAAKGQAWKLHHTVADTIRLTLKAPDCGTGCDDSLTLESNLTLPHQQWSHVAFTIEEVPGDYQTVQLWVNGQVEATASVATPGNRVLSVDTDNGKSIVLGSNFNASGYVQPFFGSLWAPRMDLELLDAERIADRSRLEVDWQVHSTLDDSEVLNGVFHFDRADPAVVGGQAMLCAPASFGNCLLDPPHFTIGEGGFTFSTEVRPHPDQASLAWLAGEGGSWFLRLLAGGQVQLKVCEDASCQSPVLLTSAVALPAGRWSSVAFQTEPGPGLRKVRLYVNGVEADSGSVAAIFHDPAKRLVLGGQKNGQGGLTKVFKGALRNVRMFRRVVAPQ